MEPVSIQMDEDKRAKMGSLQHTPSFHRCLSRTTFCLKKFQVSDSTYWLLFYRYTQPIFWLQRWQAEWSKCLSLTTSSFMWNSTSSPGVNLPPGVVFVRILLMGKNLEITSWGWYFIPLFTRLFTSQVVVWDFFHQTAASTADEGSDEKTLRVVAEVIHSYRSSTLQGLIGGWWESLLKMSLVLFWRFPEKKIIYNIFYGHAVV